MGPDRLSRRRFLEFTSLAASSAIVAACGGSAPTPAPATTAPTQVPPTELPPTTAAEPTATAPAAESRYHEAPALAEMVAAGTLPPVEERLPKEPMVVSVAEEIGQYGGTWHRVAAGPNDPWSSGRLAYECLVRWSEDASGVLPNIAKAVDSSDDYSEFTFHLREGMRWSDGEPYTADDLVFWYEDELMNADLNPTTPSYFLDPTSGEPMTLEKVDQYTVKMKFAGSYGLFLESLAGPACQSVGRSPAHYMKQFHTNYADKDELAKLTKDAGFDNWYELYTQKLSWQNPERPHVCAWLPKRVPPDVPVVFERNPYYWKVDPEGNQLPYIDSIQFEIVENADLVNLKAVAGEIDMQARHVLWTNYPLFVENAEKGNYRILQWVSGDGSSAAFYLNLFHTDPIMLELMRALDFRIALSVAMDRDEIRDLAYQGFGVGRQACLIDQSPFFKPEHATRYAEFDLDQANALLDGLGLTERDADGYRLRSDGKRLAIVIEYAPVFGPYRDVTTMVGDYWKAIGIQGIPKEEDRNLLNERGYAGEVDTAIWGFGQCFTPFSEFPYYFLPCQGWDSSTVSWWMWYMSDGAEGEEPPDVAKRQYELYSMIKASTPETIRPLADEFFEAASRELWYIGTVGQLPQLVIAKNSFRNVPEVAVFDYSQLSPGNTYCEQYFIKPA